MPAVQLGALLAMALAASAQDQLAAAGRPPAAAAVMGAIPPASSVMMGALPTPPGKVVLETKTYGTVTVDHAAHLARRTACRSCHGDGPVSKIGFTPRQAHDTCRSCHVDMQRGPTDCRGCHVIAPKPAQVVAAVKAEPASTTTALPAPPPPPSGGASATAQTPPVGPVGSASAPVAALPPPPPPPSFIGDLDDEPEGELMPFRQSVEAGMIVLGGGQQSTAVGASVRLTSRYGRAVMMHSLESAGGLRNGRTMFMVGGGALLPVQPRLALLVVGIGGLDATGREVELLPAAGIRVGLQWSRALPHVDALSASVAGVSDLVRRRNSFGEKVGDLTFSFVLSAGYGLDRGSR
jgi:hypothetical protein